MVRVVGLEPTRLATSDFESEASANSATPALMVGERGFEPLPLGYKPSARTYCATPPSGENDGD